MDALPVSTRRRLICLVPATGWVLLATASRADQPLMDEADPSAQAVAYKADATKVDKARFPKFAAGQTCANCSLYAGLPGEATGGCQLFYGYDVTAKGWCSSWEAKPR